MTYGEHHRLTTKLSLQARDQLRTICAAFPEVRETVDGHGHTAFRVRDKTFVMMGEDGSGRCSVAVKTTRAIQELLLAQEGTVFFKTPYIGQHGWVSFPADEDVRWKEEIAPLVLEAYCLAAPRRLAAALRPSDG